MPNTDDLTLRKFFASLWKIQEIPFDHELMSHKTHLLPHKLYLCIGSFIEVTDGRQEDVPNEVIALDFDSGSQARWCVSQFRGPRQRMCEVQAKRQLKRAAAGLYRLRWESCAIGRWARRKLGQCTVRLSSRPRVVSVCVFSSTVHRRCWFPFSEMRGVQQERQPEFTKR